MLWSERKLVVDIRPSLKFMIWLITLTKVYWVVVDGALDCVFRINICLYLLPQKNLLFD